MHADPDLRDVALYRRAAICRTFPAYKLSDLGPDTPVREILLAMKLLSLAQQAQAGG